MEITWVLLFNDTLTRLSRLLSKERMSQRRVEMGNMLQ
jgi:hypothetical protein